MGTISRMIAILIAAICIAAILPGAVAMSITLDPLTAPGSQQVSGTALQSNAASANDNYPISEDLAKNSVRLFMGNLSLQPEVEGVGSLEVGNYYELRAGEDTFWVNQNSGIVEFAYFGGNAPASDELKITSAQAQDKAKVYAGMKFDGYADKTWKLVVDKVRTDEDWVYNQTSNEGYYVKKKTYDFVFREEKDHVLLPSLIFVRVNAQTGDIIEYWGVDRFLTVPNLQNKVTLGDATTTATDYTYSSFKVTSSEGYLAVVTRYQNVESLAWVIKLTGSYRWDPEYVDTYVVVVDASKDDTVLATRWDSIWPESRLMNYFS